MIYEYKIEKDADIKTITKLGKLGWRLIAMLPVEAEYTCAAHVDFYFERLFMQPDRLVDSLITFYNRYPNFGKDDVVPPPPLIKP